MKKELFFKIFSIFLLIFITIVLFELFLRVFPKILPKFGWLNENILVKKIHYCKNKQTSNNAIFGDSIVEYYGDTNLNLVSKINKKSNLKKFCNYSISGASIHDYINRFLKVQSEVKIKNALFFLYEGNDFVDFFYNSNYLNEEILIYNKTKSIDREYNFFKKIVKSTYILNFVYRHFIKRYIYSPNHINESFLSSNLKKLTKKYQVSISLETILNKHNNYSKKKLKLIDSGVVNSSHYFLSLFFPNYYYMLNQPDSDLFFKQKKIIHSQLNFINSKCYDLKINCKFIIIPEANFVSKKYRSEYFDFFEFDYHEKFLTKSMIVDDLLQNFDNVYYPNKLLNYNDFLKLDGHLSDSGNEIISDFVVDIIDDD